MPANGRSRDAEPRIDRKAAGVRKEVRESGQDERSWDGRGLVAGHERTTKTRSATGLLAVLAALGLLAAACGTGGGTAPTTGSGGRTAGTPTSPPNTSTSSTATSPGSAARKVGSCPSTEAAAAAVLASSSPGSPLVPLHPEALVLCQAPLPPGARPSYPLTLGQGPAATVARIIDASPSEPASQPACSPAGPVNALLRFYAPRGRHHHVVTVLLCAHVGVYSTDRGAVVPPEVASLLWQDAVLSGTSRPKPDTPAVVGLSLRRAVAVGAKDKLGVSFGGEWVQGAVAPGTVLLQAPWKGEMQMALSVQVVVAVPPSPPCSAGTLQVTFTGFRPQPPGTTEGGDFDIRNVGHRFCRLTGSVTISGTNTAGQAVTQVATLSVPSGLVLSPSTTAVPRGSFTPAMPVYATFGFSSPDPAQCPESLVDPADWNIHVANGALTVPNGPGLTTPLGVCPTVISPRAMAAR